MQDFLHKDLIFENNNSLKQLCGEKNSNIKEIERIFDIKLHTRGNKITLQGQPQNLDNAEKFTNQIYEEMSLYEYFIEFLPVKILEK